MFCLRGRLDLNFCVGSALEQNPLNVLEGGGPNRLYHNEGDGTFVEIAEQVGVLDPVAGFPCWFWDFDNDGNLDLYVPNGHMSNTSEKDT